MNPAEIAEKPKYLAQKRYKDRLRAEGRLNYKSFRTPEGIEKEKIRVYYQKHAANALIMIKYLFGNRTLI